MSTIIHQDYSIHVAVPCTPLDLYWTMNETGTADRIDSVHGIGITPTFMSRMVPVDAPGIHGNSLSAVRIQGHDGETAHCDMFCGYIPLNPVCVALSGHCLPFSVVFWFKMSAPSPILTCDISMYPMVLHFRNTNPQTTLWYYVPSHLYYWDLDPNFTLLYDSWTFIHLFYDGTNVGFSVNNGPEYTHYPGAVLVGMAFDSFRIGVSQVSNSSTTFVPVSIDEMAIRVQPRFTATQIAYLYNGGAGRTWPIVLPP